VQNSLEAIALGGKISVLAQPIDVAGSPWVEIRIEDDGPGIPPEIRSRMFDPFYSGREAGRGLGMGLSKCWRIVTMHGGKVDLIDSSRGTTFAIRLPM
jgi:signal transduction histidine kinase